MFVLACFVLACFCVTLSPSAPQLRRPSVQPQHLSTLLRAEVRQHRTWIHYATHVMRHAGVAYRGDPGPYTPVLARAIAAQSLPDWRATSTVVMRGAGAAWRGRA